MISPPLPLPNPPRRSLLQEQRDHKSQHQPGNGEAEHVLDPLRAGDLARDDRGHAAAEDLARADHQARH